MAERATGLGLVNRRGVAAKEKFGTIVEDAPNVNHVSGSGAGSTPTSSGDGSVANGEPGTFGYKIQEFDSASSLGSLADKVAEFVTPERTPEKTPHRAVGACRLVPVDELPVARSGARALLISPKPEAHPALTLFPPPQTQTRRLAVLGVHRGAVAAPARVVLPPLRAVLRLAGAPGVFPSR